MYADASMIMDDGIEDREFMGEIDVNEEASEDGEEMIINVKEKNDISHKTNNLSNNICNN